MTQPPSNPYSDPAGQPPVDPYGTPADPYAQPIDPSAQPVDPYGQPADPYAQPADPYAQPVDPYGQPVPAEPQPGDLYPQPVDPYVNTADDSPSGTTEVAKNEAAEVKSTAVDAGQQVAGVAKDEAKNVVGETQQQAKDLVRQALGEASTQVSGQQQKAASLLQSYADELGSMASASSESGPVTDLAHQASRKVGEIGHWLEDREPGQVLDELRSFARRRPVAFLVGAALAGVVAGRLTRGLAAEAKDSDPPAGGARRASSLESASIDLDDQTNVHDQIGERDFLTADQPVGSTSTLDAGTGDQGWAR